MLSKKNRKYKIMNILRRLKNFFLESILMLIFVFLLQKTPILINIAKRFLFLIWYSLIGDINQQNCESIATTLRFGLDFKKIDLESISLMQDTWWVIVMILNGILLWNLSKNIMKLQYFSLNDVKEHLKKNVLSFLVLLMISFYSITTLIFFIWSDTSVFLISDQTQYFDQRLVSELNEILQLRKIFSVIYLIVLLLLLLLQQKKSAFWIAVTWYSGWHLISALFVVSGLSFDTFIFLYLNQSLPAETLIEMISFFPFIAAAFCMDKSPTPPTNPDYFNKSLEVKTPNIVAKPLDLKVTYPTTKITYSAPNYGKGGFVVSQTEIISNKPVPITPKGITSKEEYLRLSKIYNPCGDIIIRMANCHNIAKPTLTKNLVQWAYPPSKEGFEFFDERAITRCQDEVLEDLKKCIASSKFKNIPKK